MSISSERSDAVCYQAEALVYRQWATCLSDDATHAFVEYVVGTTFVRNRWLRVHRNPPRLTVVKAMPYSKAFVLSNRIELSTYNCTDWDVLHELGHFCVPNEADDHGPKFLGAQLALVGRFICPEAGRSLRYAYKAVGLL